MSRFCARVLDVEDARAACALGDALRRAGALRLGDDVLDRERRPSGRRCAMPSRRSVAPRSASSVLPVRTTTGTSMLLGAQRAQHLEAVQSRHHQVEHHQRRRDARAPRGAPPRRCAPRWWRSPRARRLRARPARASPASSSTTSTSPRPAPTLRLHDARRGARARPASPGTRTRRGRSRARAAPRPR